MSAIALEIAGCDRASSSAAFAMLPTSATVWSVCRSLSLRRRPMRSSHSILATFTLRYTPIEECDFHL